MSDFMDESTSASSKRRRQFLPLVAALSVVGVLMPAVLHTKAAHRAESVTVSGPAAAPATAAGASVAKVTVQDATTLLQQCLGWERRTIESGAPTAITAAATGSWHVAGSFTVAPAAVSYQFLRSADGTSKPVVDASYVPTQSVVVVAVAETGERAYCAGQRNAKGNLEASTGGIIRAYTNGSQTLPGAAVLTAVVHASGRDVVIGFKGDEAADVVIESGRSTVATAATREAFIATLPQALNDTDLRARDGLAVQAIDATGTVFQRTVGLGLNASPSRP